MKFVPHFDPAFKPIYAEYKSYEEKVKFINSANLMKEYIDSIDNK